MTPEQNEFRRRAIRAALIVVGIAAGIGLLVGGLTAAAVYVSGVLPESAPTPTLRADQPEDPDEIPSPSLSPTATPSPTDAASAAPSPTTPGPTTPGATEPTPTKPSATKANTTKPNQRKSRKPRRPQRDEAITVRAGANSAGSFERVTLSGSYPGANGTTLQVQRREGGTWRAFPTSPTVRGGTYSTYVASGQSGPNQFRVLDPTTGRTSNVVVIDVS